MSTTTTDNAEMQEVLVPQMGEGLQEVRIISFAKHPGERIRRDDILYSMETDKATMEVESPYQGVLVEWLAREGDVLKIGAPIARITDSGDGDISSEATPERGEYPQPAPVDMQTMQAAEGVPGARPRRLSPLAAATGGAPLIPPRTRALARELGISEDEMRTIHAPSGKLMPADVEAYIALRETLPTAKPATATNGFSKPRETAPFIERELAPQHRALVMRLKRSQQVVVPAVMKRSMDWSVVKKIAEARKLFGGVKPSTFQTFAFAVAKATISHPKFRSTMPTDEKVREYPHVNLGIAVGTPQGNLNIAAVPKADSLGYDDFVRTAQTNIESARNGRDQATESIQLLLTYMPGYDIEDAIPLLVSPAVAVLFISSPIQDGGKTKVNLSLTIDHRLIQGLEGAEFLKTLVEKATSMETWAG